MKGNLVSIIITTYNRSLFLEQTLRSIQNQTFQNIEILIIDDGSKTEIAKDVENICKQFSKCVYFWKPNSGQPSSRNYGISRAKGNFIGFCDDDDYWVSNKLEKQVKILGENTDFDIVVGNIEYVDANSKSFGIVKSHQGFNHGYIFEKLLIKNRTDSVTPLLRKEVFEKTGLFNPNFTISEDWDFWRKASYYHRFYAINEVLAYVRKHDFNMTGKKKSNYEDLILYKKITDSLMNWGVEKFSKQEKNIILEIEFRHYKKYISNYYEGGIKKVFFLIQLFFKKPVMISRMLKLFIKFRNNEK